MARGNRPDCAYFLILGISLAAFLLTMGGIFTYVSFWPEYALSHSHGGHHRVEELQKPHNKLPESSSSANANLSSANDAPEDNVNYTSGHLALAIMGPLCVGLGLIALLTVVVYALKFDCDHEPEPNIAFLRLKSELSLNFEAERNKYELMVPLDKPSGRRNDQNNANAQSQRY